jgi:hypothetical protein
LDILSTLFNTIQHLVEKHLRRTTRGRGLNMSSPPTNYARQANFTTFSTVHPDLPQPGIDLDSEFNSVLTVANKIIARLAEIQRADGKLLNGVVTRDSLAPDITLGFGAPTPWAVGVAYTANFSTVFNDAKFWLCKTSHVSGATFVGDALKWSLIADLGSGATDAAASAITAAISAAQALASQIAAAASATAAAASAAAAAAFDSSLYLTKAGNGAGIASASAFRTAIGVRVGTIAVFSGGADPAATAQAGDVWFG